MTIEKSQLVFTRGCLVIQISQGKSCLYPFLGHYHLTGSINLFEGRTGPVRSFLQMTYINIYKNVVPQGRVVTPNSILGVLLSSRDSSHKKEAAVQGKGFAGRGAWRARTGLVPCLVMTGSRWSGVSYASVRSWQGARGHAVGRAPRGHVGRTCCLFTHSVILPSEGFQSTQRQQVCLETGKPETDSGPTHGKRGAPALHSRQHIRDLVSLCFLFFNQSRKAETAQILRPALGSDVDWI